MESPNTVLKGRKTSPFKTPSKRQKLQNLCKKALLEYHTSLLEKEKSLNIEIAKLGKKNLDCNLDAEMQALHTYNDVKDLTQVVLGYVADAEHCTITELHQRYCLPTD
ncbi:Swi5 [Popillia japonica]|uniref:Swi5 n=1 Tax=Popillia japonica TaxID=7064 RepID=A0AAW1L6T7_POPJA